MWPFVAAYKRPWISETLHQSPKTPKTLTMRTDFLLLLAVAACTPSSSAQVSEVEVGIGSIVTISRGNEL